MSTEKKIWVDDKLVVNLNETAFDLFDKGGDRIIALYNELISKKDAIVLLAKQTEQANKFSGMINLIMDKSLSYQYIRKIMYTATEAGFKEFKFVVISNED